MNLHISAKLSDIRRIFMKLRHNVIFIYYISDDILKNIFHSNESADISVFVNGDSQVILSFS